MKITAEITGIEYETFCNVELQRIPFDDFDVNDAPSSCIIEGKQFEFAVSKWVSPKRSRSYPYERVYNTILHSKCITIIPIIKDEGAAGDRDYIQWDTVSLMSLIDVYVIFCNYVDAVKHRSKPDKITNQRINNDYIKTKIAEIKRYHSSSLHWNLKEISNTIPNLISEVKQSYTEIGNRLEVGFHNENGLDKFGELFLEGVNEFMSTSRLKASEAQLREVKTIQPKEALSTRSKAPITIKNYLGGLYYFTCDEIDIQDNVLFLIEAKHSNNAKLPSIGDIKDGFLKMILYTNLTKVMVDEKPYNPVPVLKLTSPSIVGKINSNNCSEQIEEFVNNNNFTKKQILTIQNVFVEANKNEFVVWIEKGEKSK